MRFLLPMASRDASGLVDAWHDVPDDDEGKRHAAEQYARVRAIRRRLGVRDHFEELLAQGEAVPITSLKVAQEFRSRPDHENIHGHDPEPANQDPRTVIHGALTRNPDGVGLIHPDRVGPGHRHPGYGPSY